MISDAPLSRLLSCSLLWFALLLSSALVSANPDRSRTAKKETPEITITERDDQRIEEYRIAGRLYMIKITPDKGHAYYLIDSNGDGTLDSHRPELDENLFIPSWTLFSW